MKCEYCGPKCTYCTLKHGCIDCFGRHGRIDTNSNWRHSAREISAVAAIEMGQIEQAKEHLQAIALDAQAPSGVRSRAQEQLQAIGQ